jgi:PPOX class probable F420-dependent enzyme
LTIRANHFDLKSLRAEAATVGQMALLDLARSDDRHTSERLSAEPVIWLGTVGPHGRPHNVPVWFAWHDPAVLIFSMPKTAKARNLRRSPLASLALDSADSGKDIVLAEGHAELAAPSASSIPWPGSSRTNTPRHWEACPSSSGACPSASFSGRSN